MKQLLLLDGKDYDPHLEEIRRIGIRGIIFADKKLLMIRSGFGEVKFPGGGQEPGEDDEATLIREVLEETGFHVVPESIRPFGQVEEKRLSTKETMIWHQINRYYFCCISGQQESCRYTENEKRHGMQQVWCTLEEALQTNRDMLLREGCMPWNQRELRVLEHLQTALFEKESGCLS